MSGDWWEPPVAGTDEEHLLAVLERLRATFRWKADRLDRAGLDVRIGASALTLGGLLKHLAVAEDHQFGVKVTGEPLGPPWDEVDWATVGHDWPFSSAADDEPGTLYALYDAAVERSRQRVRAALEADDRRLDQPVHISDGRGNHAERIYKLKREVIEFDRAAAPLVEPVDRLARGSMTWSTPTSARTSAT